VIIPNGLDAAQLAAVNLEQAQKEEALKAMSFIKKLDSRFKTMRDELDNAYELGRDELPTTLNAAFTMASRRRENGRLVDGQIKGPPLWPERVEDLRKVPLQQTIKDQSVGFVMRKVIPEVLAANCCKVLQHTFKRIQSKILSSKSRKEDSLP
jgi:hypothetical protein